MASSAPASGQVGIGGGPITLDLTYLLSDTIKHTYAAMMRAQVALYPVNLSGVQGSEADGAGADALADYANMDTIASATNDQQLTDLIEATRLKLDHASIEKLNAISAPTAAAKA